MIILLAIMTGLSPPCKLFLQACRLYVSDSSLRGHFGVILENGRELTLN